jgi:hypothetical protein
MPSGYAPKVLEYYNPTDTAAGAGGVSPLPFMLTPLTPTPEETQQSSAPSLLSTDTQTALTAATVTPNAIVLENMKQGTPESEWMIGAGDSSIEGFAAQFTVDNGERVDFKINTNATNYRIDIYRIGYYNGDGARKVDTINQSLSTAQIQPVPTFDPTRKLVDAGNWSVSASWNVPGDAVSGVYFARLTRLDTGGANIIPFIVRDDEAPSDITFQTSDTTWQAYNWWGGYNLYGGVDQGGKAGRASAVSYNRPITTRDGGYSAGPQDFIFSVEYPTIRWLEQNGYDVNYISGIDAARDGAQLLNSQIFLSVGHDEYWSAEQRSNVEAARDAGVNLAFLSGNEMYWQIRWESSIDGSGTPYKTMVSYKETWANADVDPGHTTGTWRDTRWGAGQPENSLTGTIFTVDSYRLDTIKIPYDLSNFRFWSNTEVANIQPGQVYSLVPNLLGYEWDSDLDNGFRPAGLIPLSSTTLDVNTLLLDHGNTTGPGTATHSLTLYRAPSGALVFGAGTVYWSWGLDSNHDLEDTPTDPNVQQAMVNLFADMGVQPQTLMQSLVVASQSTDNIAPTSVITSPTTSGSYTAAQPITIAGTATDTGGGLVAVVEVSTNGGTTWHRATGYENWSYTFVPITGGTYDIRSRAVDDNVNMEAPQQGTVITVAPAPTISFFLPSSTPAITTDNDPQAVTLGVRFSSSQSGSIVGLRYYKSVGDGGTHVGSLWSSTGTLLGSATFTQETASGWQTVTFDNPISISAGTAYVASYHSNGYYANDQNFFTSTYTSGPLSADANNGYYTYGIANAFPATASNGWNYWIDVIFSSANTVNEPPMGNNDGGFIAVQNTPITFSAATLLANDIDPNGDILSISGVGAAANGTVSFNSQTNVITFTPNPGYVGPASFGYAISDGRGGTGSAVVNMNVQNPEDELSLFSSSDVPAVTSNSDSLEVNLGVRFTSSANGVIEGIKYYKSANDIGTHTGSLWTSTGTLLATVTFSNETASGWQTAIFDNPIAVNAGTTYVASYQSNGNYASTANYFTTNHVSGVLTAPAAGNGVYAYGSANLFPTNSYSATNYWVDVIFSSEGGSSNHVPVANNDNGFTTPQDNTLTIAAATLLANDTDADGNTLTITGAGVGVNGTAGYIMNTNSVTFTPTPGYTGPASFTYAISDGNGGTATATVNLTILPSSNHPPVAVSDSGFTTTRDTALSISAATLLANDTDQDADPLAITGANGGINGIATFNAQTNTVTFTPTAGYTGPASFIYAVSDGKGGTDSTTVSLNVNAPPNQPPVAVNDSGLTVSRDSTLSIPASSLLANDTDPNNDTLTIAGIVDGSSVNGTAIFNAQTNTVSFTPVAGYTGAASFQYAVSDGRGGTANATVSLNVAPPTVSLFSPSSIPTSLSDPDTNQVNLGVRFSASINGTITGIKYYKGANDIGTHTGSLWSSTGTLLATATFTNETSSGWQTVTFSNPIAITAGTTYVASYHSNGHYTSTSGYFNNTYTNGPLSAPGSGNGVYAYGNSNLFPTSSYGASNYWVDVMFSPASSGANQSPIAANDGGISGVRDSIITIPVATLLANDSDPDGDALSVTGVSNSVNGVATFNQQTNTITFTPNAGYNGSASFDYAISDARGGTATATASLSINSASSPVVTLFDPSHVPAMTSVFDPNSIELGMRFRASNDGQITGIRFYKSAQDVGTHVGNLWSANGTLLATATFTNETASGWQQVEFASPVAINANTTYVASYHSSGNYAADPGLFNNSITNGPLTAPSSSLIGGNGVYAYGGSSLFPTSSYNSTSYGVDVLYRAQLAA